MFGVIGMGTKEYDCITIPGAVKTDLTPIGVADKALNANMFCGQSKGLGTEKDKDTAATICCKMFCTIINYKTYLWTNLDRTCSPNEMIHFNFTIYSKNSPIQFAIYFGSDRVGGGGKS